MQKVELFLLESDSGWNLSSVGEIWAQLSVSAHLPNPSTLQTRPGNRLIFQTRVQEFHKKGETLQKK